MAAAEEALLVAFGLASTGISLERESFGFRQIGTALIAVVLGGGILPQSVAAMTAEWGWAASSRSRRRGRWSTPRRRAFRVLWLGAPDGSSFPAHGGDPAGIVAAGGATVTYGLTDREGVVAIDTARPLAGPGPDALEGAVHQILVGATSHGGALLAPFGVRYVVADADVLPGAAMVALDAQADLGSVPAAGLDIWSDPVALPPAAVLRSDDALQRIVGSSDPEVIQELTPLRSNTARPGAGRMGGSDRWRRSRDRLDRVRRGVAGGRRHRDAGGGVRLVDVTPRLRCDGRHPLRLAVAADGRRVAPRRGLAAALWITWKPVAR